LNDGFQVIGDAVGTLDEWCLDAVDVHWASIGIPEARELITEAGLADLREYERSNVPLALGLNVRRRNQHRPMRKWIPTSPVFPDLLLSWGWNPIKERTLPAVG
jgi:hypothetical protein